MPATINLGDDEQGDDGYVVVSIKAAPDTAERREVKLDIYEWSSRVHEYFGANAKKPAHDYNDGLCKLLEEAGLGRVSHAVAQEFQRRLTELANDLLKKKGMIAASPTSTASGPDLAGVTAP